MVAGHWILVETLGRVETWSVLSVGGAPKQWTSLRRALPPGALAAIATAHESRTTVDRVLPTSRSRWSGAFISAVPLAGPDGVPHAVQVWISTAPDPPRQATTVGTMMFRSDRRHVLLGDDGSDVLGLGKGGQRTWTVPETFRGIERFDDSMNLIAKTIRSEPDDRWDGSLTAHTGHGLRTLQLAVRNGGERGNDRHVWRGLFTDVTETVPPEPKSFEAIALAALRRDTVTHVVLVDLPSKRPIRWITDPLPGIKWQGVQNDRPALHPDDLRRIDAAAEPLLSGQAQRTTLTGVRLRRRAGGWTVVDIDAQRLPMGEDPVFALIQLEAVGIIDE